MATASSWVMPRAPLRSAVCPSLTADPAEISGPAEKGRPASARAPHPAPPPPDGAATVRCSPEPQAPRSPEQVRYCCVTRDDMELRLSMAHHAQCLRGYRLCISNRFYLNIGHWCGCQGLIGV